MKSQEEINTVTVRLLDLKKKIIRPHYGGSYPLACEALLLPKGQAIQEEFYGTA